MAGFPFAVGSPSTSSPGSHQCHLAKLFGGGGEEEEGEADQAMGGQAPADSKESELGPALGSNIGFKHSEWRASGMTFGLTDSRVARFVRSGAHHFKPAL
jgi:hypothetical protein